MTPSKFLFDMQMNTEQKLANTHIMRIPKKIELLDMADTSLQKVCQYITISRVLDATSRAFKKKYYSYLTYF